MDFYCKEKNLIIEIDGSQHLNDKEYDTERDAYIENLGIKVLRFWNSDIDTKMKAVLTKIQGWQLPCEGELP